MLSGSPEHRAAARRGGRTRPERRRVLLGVGLLLACARAAVAAPPDALRFSQLGRADGLSAEEVRSIAEGPRGFMWFGTPAGLNRFDGYSFELYGGGRGGLGANAIEATLVDREGQVWVGTLGGGVARYDRESDRFVEYRHDPDVATSLSSDDVLALCVDSGGTLWVGSYAGLDRFDRDSGGFVHYGVDAEDPSAGLVASSVRAIIEDHRGDLWIATIGGLSRFDRRSGAFDHYVHDPADPGSLGHDDVWALAEDHEGRIWVGTDGGLSRLDPDRSRFTRYRHDEDDSRSLSDDHVATVLADSKGGVWVGTHRGGLNLFDPATNGFVRYRHDPGDDTTLGSDAVRTVFEDERGDLWVGTYGSGVSLHTPGTTAFVHTRHSRGDPTSLARDAVLSLLEDPDGTLWVGTDGGGLSRREPGARGFHTDRHDPADAGSLSSDSVQSLYRDRQGRLWVGTNHGGLNRLESDGRFVHYAHDPDDPATLSNPHVWDVQEDGHGRLWVATFEGVNLYRPESDDFVRYVHDPANPGSIGHSLAWSLHAARDGSLWIATQGGLSRYHPDVDAFETHRPPLGGGQVYAIAEDDAGRMWVGTGGGGLLLFDRASGRFEAFGAAHGLADEVVNCVAPDGRGGLWLGTGEGLSRFDPERHQFWNYGRRSGVLTGPLARTACLRTRSGELIFGGRRGFVEFDPDSVEDDAHVPPVVLTDFLIFNRSVEVGGEPAVLERPITEASRVRVRHDQSVITFAFAALSYRAPSENRYAYRLDPFDDDWARVGAKRTATYTNLDPGTYTFRVKASNDAGLWNEEGASIVVEVLPPFWETWWFRSLGVLSVALLALAVHRTRTRTIRSHNAALLEEVTARRLAEEKLERLVETLEKQNAELERFNYSVSHDLKSPLVTITGFLGVLRRSLAAGDAHRAEDGMSRIENAAAHMRRLLDELLELGRLGRLPTRLAPVSLSEVAREAADLVSGASRSEMLAIQPDMPVVQADRARLLGVYQNLLDNAVKFLGDQPAPRVEVGASREGSEVRCWVKDNGIGIDPAHTERVFNLFERLDGGLEGTGLGLSIVRRAVETHGGRAWAESRGAGHGATFWFTLPEPPGPEARAGT